MLLGRSNLLVLLVKFNLNSSYFRSKLLIHISLSIHIKNSAFKSNVLTGSCQNYYKVKKLYFLSHNLLLLRLSLLQSKAKFFGSPKMVKWSQGPSHRATRDDTRYALCPPPDGGKLSLWRKLWATVNYVTSKRPVIRIPRNKTLMEKV